MLVCVRLVLNNGWQMSLCKWLQMYICHEGCTTCMIHVVTSLYAEMAAEFEEETKNFWGDKYD